jgi:Ca2+-binding RTX toxin-like protein
VRLTSEAKLRSRLGISIPPRAPARLARAVLAASALIAAAFPGAALGGTVTIAGGTLSFQDTAAAGEVNVVTVTSGPGTIVFTEAGPQSIGGAGGSCNQPDPQVVSCDAMGMTGLELQGGNLDDRLANQTSLPARLSGDAGQDVLRGGSGADTLLGGDGVDGLVGGDGNDTEDGGPGDDAIGFDSALGIGMTAQELGNDLLSGGPGDDTLAPGPGPPLGDADTISGGDGFDAVSYAARMTPVAVSKDGTPDDGGVGERDDVALDVERIAGGLASDTLRGGPGTDVLEGAPGDDTLDALDGDDTLLGDAGAGAGSDKLSGGPGADVVQGEGGNDSVAGDEGNDIVEGGAGTDTLSGGPGADRLAGGADRDTVAYSNEPDVIVRLNKRTGSTGLPDDTDQIEEVENVRGGTRRDTVTGSDDGNELSGGADEDYLDGRDGVDTVAGGRSADLVVARDGVNDRPVSCGRGKDLAIVDRRDRVVRRGRDRCEQVDDGSSTSPSPGWIYVHPRRRCAGSDAPVELGLPAMRRVVPLRYSLLLKSGYRRRAAPTLDTTECAATLTAAQGRGRNAAAEVSGAAATLAQTPGRRLRTVLSVKRPACGAGARASARAVPDLGLRVNTRRRRASVSVKGKFSIGASRGTDWRTIEGCTSTTTIVRRGKVAVFDRSKDRTVTVRAGERYVARR